MRKRLKQKLRSCPLCKPQKTHGACRWSPKELERLKEDEKNCREAVGREKQEKDSE